METYSRPMAMPLAQRLSYLLFCVIALCVIISIGKPVLLPIAMAAYLSILLARPVVRLQWLGVPRAAAVLVVVGLAAGLLVAALMAFASGVDSFSADLPKYEEGLWRKVQLLKAAAGPSSALEHAIQFLNDLNREVAGLGSSPDRASGENEPAFAFTIGGVVQALVGLMPTMANMIAQLGIVSLLVVFFLYFREDLRNRLISLVSPLEISRTTTAIEEAMRRLVRVFTSQVLVNAAAGVMIGSAFALLGLPLAAFWGLTTAILRFVPYVGTLGASVFPVLAAIAASGDWTLPLAVLAIVIAVEIAVGFVLEPLFFGSMTGLSPIAIVIATLFWAWIWGPVGLVLSIPLTIAFSILGRHVPGFEFVEKLLENASSLDPRLRLYQRLLANDVVEATAIAEAEVNRAGALGFLAEIALPAMQLGSRDYREGVFERSVFDASVDNFQMICDDVFGLTDGERHILILHSGSAEDRAAAIAFSAVLRDRGIGHELHATGLVRPEPNGAELADVAVGCLCFMATPSGAKLDYCRRRLEKLLPDARHVSMSWQGDETSPAVADAEQMAHQLEAIGSAQKSGRRDAPAHRNPHSGAAGSLALKVT